jgi:hypothetical protein
MSERHDKEAAAPRQEVLGLSEEGRPLCLFWAGDPAAHLRVLVVGEQHGDEPRTRSAVEHFVSALPATAAVCLAAVPSLNPDGAKRRQRTNARGIDLNRDHLRLTAAETRALHSFVRRWRPHLVVDVHTYPPRRHTLLRHGLVHCHDLFLDAATYPGVPRGTVTARNESLLPRLLTALGVRGYLSGRYVVTTPTGKVRHSTTDITNLRNGLALRYGIATLLVEGRELLRRDTLADRARLLAGLRDAIEIGTEWAVHNPQMFKVPQCPTGKRMAIRCRHARSDCACTILFHDAETGVARAAAMPGTYFGSIKTTRRVRVPAAYAVASTHGALLEVLRHHGFEGLPGRAIGASMLAGIAAPGLRRTLQDYLLFPVTADGGQALVTYLEPRSKYGLWRYPDLGLAESRAADPVIRVPAEAPSQ